MNPELESVREEARRRGRLVGKCAETEREYYEGNYRNFEQWEVDRYRIRDRRRIEKNPCMAREEIWAPMAILIGLIHDA